MRKEGRRLVEGECFERVGGGGSERSSVELGCTGGIELEGFRVEVEG